MPDRYVIAANTLSANLFLL